MTTEGDINKGLFEQIAYQEERLRTASVIWQWLTVKEEDDRIERSLNISIGQMAMVIKVALSNGHIFFKVAPTKDTAIMARLLKLNMKPEPIPYREESKTDVERMFKAAGVLMPDTMIFQYDLVTLHARNGLTANDLMSDPVRYDKQLALLYKLHTEHPVLYIEDYVHSKNLLTPLEETLEIQRLIFESVARGNNPPIIPQGRATPLSLFIIKDSTIGPFPPIPGSE